MGSAMGTVRRRALRLGLCLGAALVLPGRPAAGSEYYLEPEDFLRATFGNDVPAPSTLWPTPELQRRMRAVLGHPYKVLRIRYWQRDARTAWILEDIGKSEDITIGFVLADDAIESSDVLAFREERGWEIRFPAFGRQFRGARLDAGDRLDHRIAGITGATLSVATYDRLARLALMLHQEAVHGR